MTQTNNNNPPIDLKKLRSFIEVADSLSFSRAARKTQYSVSALSIQIRELEQQLGVTLFNRVGNQVTLTNDGKKLYQYGKTMLSLSSQIYDTFSKNAELSGTIRVGATDSVCDSLLTGLLSDYVKHYPKVRISVYSYSPTQLLKYLASDMLDIVIMINTPVVDEHFAIAKGISEKVVVCCSPAFPLSQRKEICLSELTEYPSILTEKGESYRNSFENALASGNISVSPMIESKSTSLIISLLKEGIAYSVLPQFVIQKELESGQLIPVNVRDLDLSIRLQILYNNSTYLSRELQAFISLAKKDIPVRKK